MMHILICIISALLGAFGRRVAGGGFQDLTGINVGDTPVRIFFGLTIGAAALMSGVFWAYALALVILTFIGSTAGYFGGLGLGRPVRLPLPANNYWKDFGEVTAHGVLSVILPCFGAWYLGYAWWLILISGFVIAPCYEIGYRIAPYAGVQYGWVRPNWPLWLQGAVQFGEFIWGAVLGLTTALACFL